MLPEIHGDCDEEQRIANSVRRADPVVENTDDLWTRTQADDGENENEHGGRRGAHGWRHEILHDRRRRTKPQCRADRGRQETYSSARR